MVDNESSGHDLTLEALLEQVIESFQFEEIGSMDAQYIVETAFQQAGFDVVMPIEVITFRRLLTKESDRGCALAAAALLEEELKQCLLEAFVDDSNVAESLFSGNGPLGTYSSRIDLAYLIGLISPGVRRDLHLIRRIRNEFAHRHDNVQFKDPEIRDRCKELYHDALAEDLPPRVKFNRVVLGVLGMIHGCRKTLSRPSIPEEIETNKQVSQDFADELRGKIRDLFNRMDKG